MLKCLSSGQYYGEVICSRVFAGLTLSETRYPAGAHLPRHCHEHAYFCLIRQGTYREEYGGRQRLCGPLMLAFHPPEEVHAEHFDSEEVRSFNIEITPSWLRGVALLVGFADQSHFTRTFKRQLGLTSAAYRKMTARAVGYSKS